MSADPIDAAIAAASAPPLVTMRELRVTIASTGRPAIIAIPADASDGELAELAGWMLTQVLGALRAERAKGPRPRILVPT